MTTAPIGVSFHDLNEFLAELVQFQADSCVRGSRCSQL